MLIDNLNFLKYIWKSATSDIISIVLSVILILFISLTGYGLRDICKKLNKFQGNYNSNTYKKALKDAREHQIKTEETRIALEAYLINKNKKLNDKNIAMKIYRRLILRFEWLLGFLRHTPEGYYVSIMLAILIVFFPLNYELHENRKQSMEESKIHRQVIAINTIGEYEIILSTLNEKASNASNGKCGEENNLSTSGLKRALKILIETKYHLDHLELPNADLANAELNNGFFARAKFQHANFLNTELAHAILHSADLACANMVDAKLMNAILTNANLTNTKLEYANLKNANLQLADLSLANLKNADLENANMEQAVLWFVKFENTNLKNANFAKANIANLDFTNTKNLSVEQIKQACWSRNAKIKGTNGEGKNLKLSPPILPNREEFKEIDVNEIPKCELLK